jgi:hypothetical protein
MGTQASVVSHDSPIDPQTATRAENKLEAAESKLREMRGNRDRLEEEVSAFKNNLLKTV